MLPTSSPSAAYAAAYAPLPPLLPHESAEPLWCDGEVAWRCGPLVGRATYLTNTSPCLVYRLQRLLGDALASCAAHLARRCSASLPVFRVLTLPA